MDRAVIGVFPGFAERDFLGLTLAQGLRVEGVLAFPGARMGNPVLIHELHRVAHLDGQCLRRESEIRNDDLHFRGLGRPGHHPRRGPQHTRESRQNPNQESLSHHPQSPCVNSLRLCAPPIRDPGASLPPWVRPSARTLSGSGWKRRLRGFPVRPSAAENRSRNRPVSTGNASAGDGALRGGGDQTGVFGHDAFCVMGRGGGPILQT